MAAPLAHRHPESCSSPSALWSGPRLPGLRRTNRPCCVPTAIRSGWLPSRGLPQPFAGSLNGMLTADPEMIRVQQGLPRCAFPPSLVKDHREQLHKEARRLRLLTHSSGIGDARAIRVLPRGASVPEPTAHVRRLAGMVYDWLRDEAEQAGEEASGPPFSRGEVVELVELADREHANGSAPLPAAIASLIRRAHAVAATAPSPGEGGEQLAVRVRSDYERALVVRGCSEAVVSERSPTSRSAPGDRHRHSRGGSARGRRK